MHDYTHRVDNSPGKSEADIFKVALTGDEILLNAETTVIATTRANIGHSDRTVKFPPTIKNRKPSWK